MQMCNIVGEPLMDRFSTEDYIQYLEKPSVLSK